MVRFNMTKGYEMNRALLVVHFRVKPCYRRSGVTVTRSWLLILTCQISLTLINKCYRILRFPIFLPNFWHDPSYRWGNPALVVSDGSLSFAAYRTACSIYSNLSTTTFASLMEEHGLLRTAYKDLRAGSKLKQFPFSGLARSCFNT